MYMICWLVMRLVMHYSHQMCRHCIIQSIPSSYINVIEDARIEKLIKRKFPGLCKSFFRGYWELHEQDFFEVQGLDSDDITLIDRINLYYKGSKDMVFADDEKVFVERTGNTETFEEVCELAAEIHAFMKEQKEKKRTRKD